MWTGEAESDVQKGNNEDHDRRQGRSETRPLITTQERLTHNAERPIGASSRPEPQPWTCCALGLRHPHPLHVPHDTVRRASAGDAGPRGRPACRGHFGGVQEGETP